MRREVDVLLIDLPGVVAPAMGAAFLIASLILIPTVPQAVDVEGTRRVMAHLEKAQAERPQAPPQALLVPVRVRDLERGLVPWQDILAPLGVPMTPPLRHQIAFDRAFEEGRWVGERFPGSDAHREVQAVARRVLDELDRVGPPPAFGLARPDPARGRELALAEAPASFVHAGERRPWWRRVLGG
jgi:cellulose biosynthesis protein BcsQ